MGGRGAACAEWVGRVEGVSASPMGEGSGEGLYPLPRIIFFVFSLKTLKIPYFDELRHVYFLNHTPVGGDLTPLNLLLGTLLHSTRCRPRQRCQLPRL